jgi:malyl-CoA/(S)-citramalyl-CoA lyase
MSFTAVEHGRPRLNRSELAVPGSRPEMFEKGARSAADIVFLDLEDSVAPDDKPRARKNIVTGLREVDWGNKTVSVRINGLDTPYMYRDVIDVMELGGERLDLIMIPKVGTPADVYAVDMLVTQIEQAKGWKKNIGFELIIETAQGMANVEAIAKASRRLESLHLGVAVLWRLDGRDGGRRPVVSLGRSVALRAVAPGRGGPREWLAPARRAFWRHSRCRRLQGPGQSCRRVGL